MLFKDIAFVKTSLRIMYNHMKSRLNKVLTILLIISSGLTWGQSHELSGEWVIQFGGSNKSEATVSQTGEQLVFWIKVKDELLTYTGTIENDSIELSQPTDGNWESAEERECHKQIMAQPELYPNYKSTIKLKVKDNTMEGSYTFTKTISCEEDVVITISEPKTVKLTPVNYCYWISSKRILKAPNNKLELQDTIYKSEQYIKDLVVDEKGNRLYWAEGNHIYSVNQKGKSKLTMTTAKEAVFSPHSLAVDNKNSKLFWIEGDSIMSTPLRNNLRTSIRREPNSPIGLKIDESNEKLYWIAQSNSSIRRSNLDGSEAEDFVTNITATYLDIDEKKKVLYFTTYGEIKKVALNDPGSISDVRTGLNEPKDVFVDSESNRLFWIESGSLTKYIVRSPIRFKKRKDTILAKYSINDLTLGPKGPSSYDEVKIEGSLMLKESVAGKSLLQELIKNDTYYQVLLSEYASQESDFNLTDTRLLLLWGEKFPKRRHRGNNIVFTSSDPKIKYQEYDTWNYRLDDTQRDKYNNYPLWLTKNSGLKARTWDMAWKFVKDSLGQTGLDSIKEMDHMLVLATPTDGVTPGLKSFTMNDAEADWYLKSGNTNASMRFFRKLPNGNEETIQNIYAGDPFFIEVNLSKELPISILDLSFFIDNQPLQMGRINLKASKQRNKKVYRTSSITLQEFSQNGGQLQIGMQGGAQSVCKVGSIFKAAVSNNALFNNGIAPSSSAPLTNPTSSLWHKTLGETIALTNLSIPEDEWERSLRKPIETFTNMDISEPIRSVIDYLKGRRSSNRPHSYSNSCTVMLGDYSAMILLKRYFVQHMTSYSDSLQKKENDAIFRYGFWEMMRPQMSDENFPLGHIEVTDDEVPLRQAFSKNYILEKYSDPKDAERWIKAAKKDGFTKYLNSVERSLAVAKGIDDKEIKKLMELTGFGFKAMIDLVTSDLQKKKYDPESDLDCEVTPHIWEPDYTGRNWVKTMSSTAKHCRANDDLQAAGTDVLLASASLLVFPIGAVGAYGKVAAAVYGAALGSGEIIRDNIKFSDEDRELDFSAGSFALLGTERYAMAKLKVTPTWARMLSYFGGGLGVAGDAFDILKFVGKVDMASAYRKLPGILNDINSKGALDAYQAMSKNNKARFLLLLGEAEELKRLPTDQLSDAQKRLMMAAEQFSEELDVAAKAKKTITQNSDAAVSLSEGLPSNLKDKVPIIKDDALPGSSVRIEYELDTNGFLSKIKLRAGKSATVQHIAEHVPTLTKMKEFEATASRAANLYRKIRHWYRRIFKGDPPLGSKAWESMQEIQKLNAIIDNRLGKLASGIDAVDPQVLTKELQYLTKQLTEHQKTFEKFINNPALGRGFVAADGLEAANSKARVATRNMLDDLADTRIPSNKSVLCAQAKRIKKALAYLDTSNPQFLNDLLDIVVRRSDARTFNQLTKILEGIAQIDNLSPSHFKGIKSFLEATGDMEALGVIFQRATRGGDPDIVRTILGSMGKMAQNEKALGGMASYIKRMGYEVGTVSKLRDLIEKTDAMSFTDDLFEVVHTFRNNDGFHKVLQNLSRNADNGTYIDDLAEFMEGVDELDKFVDLNAFNDIAFKGALGHIFAAKELIKKYNPSQLIFEFRVPNAQFKDFRFIDILVASDDLEDVLKIVEIKEYSKLEGLFKFGIKKQFAKDIFIAHLNGLSLTSGVRWMISKSVLIEGRRAAQLLKLKKEFLKVFDNASLKKKFFCNMSKTEIDAFKAEIQDNFDEIFKFF
ncbi:hypothetical protein Q4Q34_16990 [Flavivirga abyssicola]|uniref:hypothetical protein n=1 Tax=Flavivirga abyssicola TaxID=3063533 RepID=UPI0026E11025|nr:hypothetical protein [Flavivirga sp. MEBiC07777]WVK12912.1 hypothetical protein Q4Q34_16990 [Flavivirga sp. MEBiC07777]